MRVSYKTIIWQTAYFDDSETTLEELIKAYHEGGVQDMFDNIAFIENVVDFSNEEIVTLEENEGYTTVEIRDSEGKLIWRNGE